MRRTTPQIVRVLAALLMAGGSSRAGAMDLPTLAAAVRSQLSSISSIEVKYRKVFQDPEGPEQVRECEWAEQGECRRLITFRPGTNRQPEALFFDGDKGYDYSWDPSGKQAPRLAVRDSINPGYWKSSTPANFIGRLLTHQGTSLVDLLESPDSELVGTEVFGGSSCWKVEVPSFGPASPKMRLTTFLDAEHDFLPAQITIRFANDGKAHPEAPRMMDYFRTWTINEFMQVNDGATGRPRWFPKSVTLNQTDNLNHTFTITSAKLNEPLPLENFRPNAPDGTFVTKADARGGTKFHIQGSAATNSLVDRAAADALSELRSRQGTAPFAIDARPRRSKQIVYIVFGSSVFLCSVAAFIWFRRSRL